MTGHARKTWPRAAPSFYAVPVVGHAGRDAKLAGRAGRSAHVRAFEAGFWRPPAERFDAAAAPRSVAFAREEPRVFAAQDARSKPVASAVLSTDAFVLRFFGPNDDDRLLIVNFGRDLHLDPAVRAAAGPGLEAPVAALMVERVARLRRHRHSAAGERRQLAHPGRSGRRNDACAAGEKVAGTLRRAVAR